MSRKKLKEGALLAPVPPVLVSVGDSTESNIITVAWCGILATHPPRTYVSVRPSRHSYGILKRTGEFVINLAPARLAREVDFCGIYTGAKVDKFAKCGFAKEKSCEVEAPTIKECPLAIECKVAEVIPMGTHDVFVADIVSVSCDEEMLDSDGSLRFDKAELLAYAHGEYFGLGASLGKFGFSTKKDVKGGGVSRKTLQAKSEKEEKEGESKRPFYMDIAKKGSRAKASAKKGKRTVRK